jgi:hypothetical protein
VSRMLGDEFGKPIETPSPDAAVEPREIDDHDALEHEFEPGYDGERSEAVHVDESELRIELAELYAELEAARRENENLLVEKDAAGELVLSLRKQVDGLENEVRTPDQRARRSSGQPDGNEPVFASLGEWVGKWLLPLYRRELDNRSTTFCVQWWRHPESYYRLDALWKSWEYMRLKPGTGTAVWLKDYCDPHMAVLMSSNGPMSGCTLKKHSEHATEPWPLEPIPGTRQLVRLYDVAGMQYTDPKPAVEGRRALGAVEALPWDGKDQQ